MKSVHFDLPPSPSTHSSPPLTAANTTSSNGGNTQTASIAASTLTTNIPSHPQNQYHSRFHALPSPTALLIPSPSLSNPSDSHASPSILWEEKHHTLLKSLCSLRSEVSAWEREQSERLFAAELEVKRREEEEERRIKREIESKQPHFFHNQFIHSSLNKPTVESSNRTKTLPSDFKLDLASLNAAADEANNANNYARNIMTPPSRNVVRSQQEDEYIDRLLSTTTPRTPDDAIARLNLDRDRGSANGLANDHDDIMLTPRMSILSPQRAADSNSAQQLAKIYEKLAMEQRRALRRHPKIQKWLNKFWLVFAHNSTREILEKHGITKQQFISFYQLLHKALQGDVDMTITACSDWERFCSIRKSMNSVEFSHVLFEIIDAWVNSHLPQDYITMLKALYCKMTRREFLTTYWLDASDSSITSMLHERNTSHPAPLLDVERQHSHERIPSMEENHVIQEKKEKRMSLKGEDIQKINAALRKEQEEREEKLNESAQSINSLSSDDELTSEDENDEQNSSVDQSIGSPSPASPTTDANGRLLPLDGANRLRQREQQYVHAALVAINPYLVDNSAPMSPISLENRRKLLGDKWSGVTETLAIEIQHELHAFRARGSGNKFSEHYADESSGNSDLEDEYEAREARRVRRQRVGHGWPNIIKVLALSKKSKSNLQKWWRAVDEVLLNEKERKLHAAEDARRRKYRKVKKRAMKHAKLLGIIIKQWDMESLEKLASYEFTKSELAKEAEVSRAQDKEKQTEERRRTRDTLRRRERDDDLMPPSILVPAGQSSSVPNSRRVSWKDEESDVKLTKLASEMKEKEKKEKEEKEIANKEKLTKAQKLAIIRDVTDRLTRPPPCINPLHHHVLGSTRRSTVGGIDSSPCIYEDQSGNQQQAQQQQTTTQPQAHERRNSDGQPINPNQNQNSNTVITVDSARASAAASASVPLLPPLNPVSQPSSTLAPSFGVLGARSSAPLSHDAQFIMMGSHAVVHTSNSLQIPKHDRRRATYNNDSSNQSRASAGQVDFSNLVVASNAFDDGYVPHGRFSTQPGRSAMRASKSTSGTPQRSPSPKRHLSPSRHLTSHSANNSRPQSPSRHGLSANAQKYITIAHASKYSSSSNSHILPSHAPSNSHANSFPAHPSSSSAHTSPFLNARKMADRLPPFAPSSSHAHSHPNHHNFGSHSVNASPLLHPAALPLSRSRANSMEREAGNFSLNPPTSSTQPNSRSMSPSLIIRSLEAPSSTSSMMVGSGGMPHTLAQNVTGGMSINRKIKSMSDTFHTPTPAIQHHLQHQHHAHAHHSQTTESSNHQSGGAAAHSNPQLQTLQGKTYDPFYDPFK